MEAQTNPAAATPPISAPFKLSWREKYAGIMVLLMGLGYLVLFITEFTSTTITGYTRSEGKLQIDIHELLNHIRGVTIILLSIIGSWLLLKMKRAGWVISMAMLLLLSIIAGGFIAWNFKTATPTAKAVYFSGLALLLFAVLFLLLPSARKKYKVGKFTFLPTLLLLLVLAAMFFFLQ